METINQEQFLALGALGIAIVGAVLLVSFAVMAGTFKLSVAWLGKSSPSYLACFGWMLAITFVNSFLVFGAMIVFGEVAAMMVTPLTWFVTLYMVSTAANCGLMRAFGIWLVNSFLSGIGLAAIAFVVTIPLAIIGAGVNAGGENLQAEFDKVDAMMADLDSQMEELEQFDFPQTTEVSFPTETSIDDDSIPTGDGDQVENDTSDEALHDSEPTPVTSSTASDRAVQHQPRKTSPSRPVQTRRAADGSTINPFFQD